MGLLNVYKFSNTIVPLLSNRFKVTFYTTNSPSEEWDETVTSFNVKSVEMPSYKIETDDTRIRFGNTQFVIPLLHFSGTELHITFTETDGFDVHRFLSTLMSDEYFNISNTIQIKIKVDELTYDMSNIISTRIFICRLLKFDQPTYASSSRSDIMEIGATFYVEYELNSLLDTTTVAQLKQENAAKTNDESKTTSTTEESTTCPADAIDINQIEADFGSFKEPTMQNNTKGIEPPQLTGDKEKDVKALYHYAMESGLGRNATKDSEERWLQRFNEDIKAGKIKNQQEALEQIRNTLVRVNETNIKLAEQGSEYRLGLAGAEDTYGAIMGGHGDTSNHNSRNGGSKVDAKIYDKNGNVVDLDNESNRKAVFDDIADTNLWQTGVFEKGNTWWFDLDTNGKYDKNVTQGDKQGDWSTTGVNGNLNKNNKNRTMAAYNTKATTNKMTTTKIV